MKFELSALFVAPASLARLALVQACTECTNTSPEPLTVVPGPWTLRADVYSITILPLLTPLPDKAFSPLERHAATASAGRYVGILGMIQIIRYSESPVGPYDELLIVPGFWEYEREDGEGKKRTHQNVRISRIYVSQKYTCYNGRHNWNIPKHLARFDWTQDSRTGSTTVKVYPFDTTGDPTESGPAPKPFFQTTFQPTPLRKLAADTDLYKLVGINATLVQPPLPERAGSAHGELVGTSQWVAVVPGQRSNDGQPGLFDLDQGAGDVVADGKNAVGDEYFPNFWPGLPRLNLGHRLNNATVTFSKPEAWNN